MPYTCDHCDEELLVERGSGRFIDHNGSDECAESPTGEHTWDGRSGL